MVIDQRRRDPRPHRHLAHPGRLHRRGDARGRPRPAAPLARARRLRRHRRRRRHHRRRPRPGQRHPRRPRARRAPAHRRDPAATVAPTSPRRSIAPPPSPCSGPTTKIWWRRCTRCGAVGPRPAPAADPFRCYQRGMLDRSVFAARRQAYLDALGPNAVAIVDSLPERLRNGDAHYPFRQHSDLLYLTGFAEPETTVVLRPGRRQRAGRHVRAAARSRAARSGTAAAPASRARKERYGADEAYPAAELPDAAARADRQPRASSTTRSASIRDDGPARRGDDRAAAQPRSAASARRARSSIRATRSTRCGCSSRPRSSTLLRKAAAHHRRGARRARCASGRPGIVRVRARGDDRLHVPPAAAPAPGYAHHRRRRRERDDPPLRREQLRRSPSGELVLIDAGCEYDYYTADVTRTFPVARPLHRGAARDLRARARRAGGRDRDDPARRHRSTRSTQRCVRRAHRGHGRARPARRHRPTLASRTWRTSGSTCTGTSHWLGMDVHDVGAYTRDGKAAPARARHGAHRRARPLHRRTTTPTCPTELRGIGVRIEDDILVTAAGHDNLTAACPKEVADLEAICTGAT